MRKIVLFTNKDCHRCKAVKDELKKELGADYNSNVYEFDVGSNLEAMTMITLMGYVSLPVIAVFDDFSDVEGDFGKTVVKYLKEMISRSRGI